MSSSCTRLSYAIRMPPWSPARRESTEPRHARAAARERSIASRSPRWTSSRAARIVVSQLATIAARRDARNRSSRPAAVARRARAASRADAPQSLCRGFSSWTAAAVQHNARTGTVTLRKHSGPPTQAQRSHYHNGRRCDRRRRVQHNAHNLRTPKHGGRARLLRRRPRKNREKTRNWRFTNFAPTLTAEPS